MNADCKHPRIQTWRFEDSAEVAGLWSCADCGRRFEPVAPVVDRVPLTYDAAHALFELWYDDDNSGVEFVRMIERTHGITAAKDKP